MVNCGDLFVCLVAGLAVPLALVDGLRAVVDGPILRRGRRRAAVNWFLALVAGPGFFIETMLDQWRQGDLDRTDAINATVIALGWATLYGYVLLGLSRRLLSIG